MSRMVWRTKFWQDLSREEVRQRWVAEVTAAACMVASSSSE